MENGRLLKTMKKQLFVLTVFLISSSIAYSSSSSKAGAYTKLRDEPVVAASAAAAASAASKESFSSASKSNTQHSWNITDFGIEVLHDDCRFWLEVTVPYKNSGECRDAFLRSDKKALYRKFDELEKIQGDVAKKTVVRSILFKTSFWKIQLCSVLYVRDIKSLDELLH